MTQLIPLFPTPVYHANIGSVDPTTMAWIKNLEYENQSVAYDKNENSSPENRGMHMLHNKKLSGLRSVIEKTLHAYAFDIIKINTSVNFELQTSWINKTRSVDSIAVHNHSNSHISGVYYLEVGEKCSPLNLIRPLSHNNIFHSSFDPGFQELNMLNTDRYEIYPRNGDVVLFPSWLEHWVASGGEGDRFSLAFNFFGRGSYGVGTEQITI